MGRFTAGLKASFLSFVVLHFFSVFYLSIGRIDFVTLLSSDVNCQPGDGEGGGWRGGEGATKIQNTE